MRYYRKRPAALYPQPETWHPGAKPLKGNTIMRASTQTPTASAHRPKYLSWLMWLAAAVLLMDGIRTGLQVLSQASAVPFSDLVK